MGSMAVDQPYGNMEVVVVSKKCDFASIDCSGVVERLLLRVVGLWLGIDLLVVGGVFLLLAEPAEWW